MSGPLLDRIDVRVQVDPVAHADLFTAGSCESSASVAARVALARLAAAERWSSTPWRMNGSVPGSVLRAPPWALQHSVLHPAEAFLQRGEITARGFDRVLRLAWSVADLAGRTVPNAGDVAEALYFRTGEHGSWAA